MRTTTAAEASRNFSYLLDAVERGETVAITRGRRVVAELRPVRQCTGADLRAALEQIPPPDDHFAADHHIDLVRVCRASSGDPAAQLEEVSDLQWASLGELAAPGPRQSFPRWPTPQPDGPGPSDRSRRL